MPNHLCGNQTPSSEGHPEFDFPHRVARQNTCIPRTGRPAVVAPRIHVVAVDAAAECLDVVEEELVRSSYLAGIQNASEDHKAALVEVGARRSAVGDVKFVDVDEARRFCSARLHRHARHDRYACQRESHSIRASAISCALLGGTCPLS